MALSCIFSEFQNPEHLLLFAAGNDGAPEDSFRTSCTINIPGIGKNVMAVGSSSSGPTRWSLTAADGDAIEAFGPDHADIDTVSFFSSYGLTKDSRIKPEILAPGDQVRSCVSGFRHRVSFRQIPCRHERLPPRHWLASLGFRLRERRSACRVKLGLHAMLVSCPVLSCHGCLLVSLSLFLPSCGAGVGPWDENTMLVWALKTFSVCWRTHSPPEVA